MIFKRLFVSEAEPPVQGAPAPLPEAPLVPLAILLADDSSMTRSLLRHWLEKAGFQVDLARDGQEAWEAFRARPGHYAMLITDVVMPRMDGLHLSSRIRETDPSFPVLMLSSSEDPASYREALHLHVDAFLSKPFDARTLVTAVERLFAEHAGARRARTTAGAVRLAQQTLSPVPAGDFPIQTLSEPLADGGGDVFRAFRRPDGSLFFTLADVAGHSVLSSFAVAAFLGTLSNLVAGDLDLLELARRINTAILGGPFSQAPICALFAHWDTRDGRLHLLNAGIPHPLWFRASQGRTLPIALDGAPLGILDQPLVEEKVVALAPGDRLLLGSDGFFDALSRSKVAFQGYAGSIWTSLGGATPAHALKLVSEAARIHAGGRFDDDLLVATLEQPPLDLGPAEFSLTFASEAWRIDGACMALEAHLDARGWLAQADRYATLLAVREALTNAMVHGNAQAPATSIRLSAQGLPGGGLRVRVLDEGRGFDLASCQPPDVLASSRGRGLPLIRHFTRSVAMVGGELTMTFQASDPGVAP